MDLCNHCPQAAYHYEFTTRADHTTDGWRRTRFGTLIPPITLDEPGLMDYLRSRGWRRR